MKGTSREGGKIWGFLLITNHELQREQWKFFGMGVGGVGEADTIRHVDPSGDVASSNVG